MELTMKKVSVIAAAVAATLAAGSAFAVDFNGYFRAGTGISGNGDADISFQKNGIGRLGNENDNYYEFGFSEELKTGDHRNKGVADRQGEYHGPGQGVAIIAAGHARRDDISGPKPSQNGDKTRTKGAHVLPETPGYLGGNDRTLREMRIGAFWGCLGHGQGPPPFNLTAESRNDFVSRSVVNS